MQQGLFTRAICRFFQRLFHKRNIIIISNHRTNHVAMSVRSQLAVVTAVLGFVCWASYSTGSYMAAKSVMEEQDHALQSVANSRIDSNFGYFSSSLTQPGNLPAPKPAATETGALMPLTDPIYTFSAISHDKLYARIAMLEGRVEELKSVNHEIIETVREKTSGKISDLEAVIRSTGLSVDSLKSSAPREKDSAKKAEASEPVIRRGGKGGPYVPSYFGANIGFEEELNENLDKLADLNEIIASLPLGRPIQGASVESNFGSRIDPFNGRMAFHSGVDLAGPAGAQVKASNAGKVITAQYNGAYGNMVDIDHGYGVTTRYGHLSRILVQPGQQVAKGEAIGVQGSTGRSTGAHLHYEVRYRDKPMNPTNFLRAGQNVF